MFTINKIYIIITTWWELEPERGKVPVSLQLDTTEYSMVDETWPLQFYFRTFLTINSQLNDVQKKTMQKSNFMSAKTWRPYCTSSLLPNADARRAQIGWTLSFFVHQLHVFSVLAGHDARVWCYWKLYTIFRSNNYLVLSTV